MIGELYIMNHILPSVASHICSIWSELIFGESVTFMHFDTDRSLNHNQGDDYH